MTKILLAILALLVIAVLILIVLRRRNDLSIRVLWRSLETPPTTENFT
jgi:hypothetical protein